MINTNIRKIDLSIISDSKGSLVPIEIEELLPFRTKRIYYCYDNHGSRAGHCHLTEEDFFVCIKGHVKLEYNFPVEWFVCLCGCLVPFRSALRAEQMRRSKLFNLSKII